MTKDIFEDLHYHSGLVASGCWNELDEYDREAIIRFGDLIVAECLEKLYLNGYDDAAETIKNHFMGNNDSLIYASTLMSDKGYQESTHEKQQEFAKNRNYTYE